MLDQFISDTAPSPTCTERDVADCSMGFYGCEIEYKRNLNQGCIEKPNVFCNGKEYRAPTASVVQ